ncbi:MAG: FAD-dependent oxidoreductase [Deltaproteobacteria bacterium]|nr:FAD-dependent oxidoreductase [Deltaproteobacteria bacterium]
MGKQVVIVGAGAGGASVAAEAKRTDPSLSIVLIEQRSQVSVAACPMPYYIGDAIGDEKKLIARTPEKFRETGIDVRIDTRVEEVDPNRGRVRLADGATIPYDTLVLGTGTKPLLPGIPGEDREGVFTLKSLADAVRIKAWLKEIPCRKAIIVGAGFIGMEMCEALRNLGIEIQVFHRGTLPVNRWDREFSQAVLDEIRGHGVEFITEAAIQAIEEGNDHRLKLVTNHGDAEADMILMAVGVRPEVALAQQMEIELGESGAIRVDFSQRTLREGVYAVGDCCESFHRVSGRWVNIPLGDIANKQGRVAGRNIGGGSMVFPGIVGAQSFKIFSLEVAATGLDEREAARSGFLPISTLIWGNAIAGPMPENTKLGLKLIADRTTGKLLGAQAVGKAGAVSRINTLSCALWAGLTLDDIGWFDLAYAPPVGPAWDPIHIAAQKLRKEM